MLDLSIIIVSWNVADYLARCLDSILASNLAINEAGGARRGMEIIIVDSASQDNTVELLRERYPQVHLYAQAENVGFTKGNNIGLRAARGKYILLLNPDTEIIGDALLAMMEYLEAHPEVGVLGPHTLNTDGSHQSTRRRFPSLVTAYFESTWLQPYAPNALLDRYYVRDAEDNATVEVDWVQGSAILMRREVYEQVGGLDEGYIMFSEELDWCRRAKDAGWHIAYLGSAHVTHHGGKSSDQVTSRKHIHFQESKLRYLRKHHGYATASFFRLFLLASYELQIAIETIKAMLGSQPKMRKERAAAYREVLRSGLKVT
jgi:N-acetylglucosaminyl-diphospho-decaprenol L-rhamnosyltransferase